jgi:hypothetical protein
MDLNMSPVPTGLSVQIEDLSEEIQAVLMLVTTPPGIHGYFLSPDQAVQIGNQMLNLGQQIQRDRGRRLTVAKKPGIVVPGGHHPSTGGTEG